MTLDSRASQARLAGREIQESLEAPEFPAVLVSKVKCSSNNLTSVKKTDRCDCFFHKHVLFLGERGDTGFSGGPGLKGYPGDPGYFGTEGPKGSRGRRTSGFSMSRILSVVMDKEVYPHV